MTNRIFRINEDIQRELAALLRNIKDPRIKKQGMISITAVNTSGDLGQAKVYLSVYNLQSAKEFKDGLKSASGHLRYELGKALSLRHTPELKFILDESIERGAKINAMISTLDIAEGVAEDTADTAAEGVAEDAAENSAEDTAKNTAESIAEDTQ